MTQNNLEFTYQKSQLIDSAQTIIEQILELGATSAELEISEGIETSVEVLNNQIDNIETFYSSVLSLTVYVGKKKGSIGVTYNQIGDNIKSLIAHAIDIAKYTQEDNASGIPEVEHLSDIKLLPDLELYSPIILSHEQLISYSKELESQSIALNNFESNGSSVDCGKYNFITANSNGFYNGYQTTRFSCGVSLIDKKSDNMQTDYWYAVNRSFTKLQPIKTIAQQANNRLKRRLSKGAIDSGTYPVIFDSQVAKSFIATIFSALNGNNIYRNLSFLNNSINTQIMPKWISIYEDPFVKQGIASCYFDVNGVRVAPRFIIKDGIIETYILSCYSARKLNMCPTGHNGGMHNVTVSSNFDGNLSDMAKTMERGLIIIETIGSGVNSVTGDYSVGASGLWVEHGNIQFFVDNITISGNLKNMYQDIEYIATETDNNGSSINCGPILIKQINLSS